MSGNNDKSLNDVLKEMPSLVNRKLELALWLDTIDTVQNSTPVVHMMEVRFLMPEKNIVPVLKLIDAYYPIVYIRDFSTGIVYHVTKTEKFMNKPCEGCQ